MQNKGPKFIPEVWLEDGMKSFHVMLAVVAALLLMTGAASAANHTISVKVTGLTGTLVMQDNKLDTLTFTTNSTQTFSAI